MKKIYLLSLITSLLWVSTVMGHSRVGNGGGGLLCSSSSGESFLFTLDALYDIEPRLYFESNLSDEDLGNVLNFLLLSYAKKQGRSADIFMKWANNYLDNFILTSFFEFNVPRRSIDDVLVSSDMIAQAMNVIGEGRGVNKEDCSFVQLAYFKESAFFMNLDYFEQLSSYDLLALFLHEIIYSYSMQNMRDIGQPHKYSLTQVIHEEVQALLSELVLFRR